MKELRRIVEQTTSGSEHASETIGILFFYQGSVEDGEAFFQRYWPEARAVSDLSKEFYEGFGLERASLRQLFGPEVLACGLQAAKNGSYGGKPVGDPRMMPGMFLVEGGRIVWQHDYRHIGDHPDFEKILISDIARDDQVRQTQVRSLA